MTKFSKVLTIFLAVASLAFMAFAGAVSFAGRNWEIESRADDLEAFQFEKSESSEGQVTWKVTQLYQQKSELGNNQQGGGPETAMTASSSVLPDVIFKARNQLLQEQTSRINQIRDQLLPNYQQQLQIVRTLIRVDEAALKQREETLVAQLAQLQQQVDTLSRQVVSKSQEAQALRTQAAQRRDDAMRLANQLELIRAEIFQIEEQQKLLRDLLYRLEGKVDIAQRTNDKLKQSDPNKPYEEEDVPQE